MTQRQIGCLAGLHTPTNTHQVGTHGIERRGFGIDGHTLGGFQLGQPSIELIPRQNGFVVFVARDSNHWLGLCKQIVLGHKCRLGSFARTRSI